MRSFLLIILFTTIVTLSNAQNTNSYGLKVDGLAQYTKDKEKNANMTLVDLKKHIPSIVLDVKYATKDNFMRKAMYSQARAFARKAVADKLKEIQQQLSLQGLGLKIFDGYRPYSVTVDFYNQTKEKSFVANPKNGSKHNRGAAVDLTLIDLKTGKELEMPTQYDSFSASAAPDYEPVSALARKNRALLIQVMEKNGFKVLNNEWWHFDFIGWQNYPLMDIPFEKL